MRKFVFSILLFTLLLAACGPQQPALPPVPTNTPVPTFTPTPEIVVMPVDPAAAETARAVEAEATAAANQEVVVVVEEPAPEESAGEPSGSGEQAQPVDPSPTETPAPPADPAVVIGQNMNVRSGPGTNYAVIGTASSGQRYGVTGKNSQGDWWQINYNGQAGWVYGPLVTAQNTGAVAVAANIPAPPPPPTPVPATATPVPQPTATPAPAQPTAPPAPRYKFNIAVVGRCDRQPAGTWFEGKTYVGGQPQSGYKVVFSYAPDGPWVTQPQISGPHEGYPNWDAGYYSHIVSASGPIAGTWFVWIVDDGGNRISEMASWSSTGPGDACNQAVVDFDSR